MIKIINESTGLGKYSKILKFANYNELSCYGIDKEDEAEISDNLDDSIEFLGFAIGTNEDIENHLGLALITVYNNNTNNIEFYKYSDGPTKFSRYPSKEILKYKDLV